MFPDVNTGVLANAVWIQHGGEIGWALGVADELAELGVHVRFVSFMRKIHDAYLGHGRESEYLPEIFGDDRLLGADEQSALERKYGPPSLACMVASDEHLRMLYGEDSAPKERMFARALRFWEEYFDAHDIRLVLLRDRASLSTRSAHQVALKRGDIEVLQLGVGPDDEHFALYDMGTHFSWQSLVRRMASPPPAPGVERRAEIDRFVARRVPESKSGRMHLKLVEETVIGRLAGALRFRQLERRLSQGNPMELAVARLSRHLSQCRANWRRNRRGFSYAMPGSAPYVFLPLFHTSESVHLVNIRHWCRNIIELVRAVAEALPEGHELYVKEHPVILGDMSRAQMDALQSIRRVRVIDPSVQSQQLTRGAAAVVTTEGTVGWEAYLLKRPVVLLGGEPFYAHAPQIAKVKDLFQLETALFNAVMDNGAMYAADPDAWYGFIDAVLSTSYPGVIETFEYPHITDTSRNNLRAIAAALAARVAVQ